MGSFIQKATGTIILIFAISVVNSCRKGEYLIDTEYVEKDLGGGTGTVTWTNDKSYLLDGFVFVNDGQTLTIEEGTIIRAKTGQGSQASALIVAQGGKLIAQGTSKNPIIFTVEGDDLTGSVPVEAKGLWGGLVILGRAPVNTEHGEGFIEGIPISEPRGIYGGIIEDDNSGILQYISIRHGGTNIGEGNEINGLTLGGVGRKTIIDHIEIISNADDGVEFFGGTVNCRNIAVAFCGDDAFDFDEGYSGKCQFLLAIIDPETGDHLAELSGNTSGYMSSQTTNPIVYNSTFVGSRNHAEYLMTFDHNSAGTYRNNIFLGNLRGISIEYNSGTGSFEQMKKGKLLIENNVFYDIANNNADSIFIFYPDSGASADDNDMLKDYFRLMQNSITDPGLDFESTPIILMPPSTIFTDLAEYNSDWFEKVTYKGAFGSNNWLVGWSLLWEENIVGMK